MPPLPLDAAEAIFADIEKAAREGGPEGRVNQAINRLIGSAQKGTIVDYERTGGKPIHKLEVDLFEGKPPVATETVFGRGENGEQKVFSESKITLENLNTRTEFQK